MKIVLNTLLLPTVALLGLSAVQAVEHVVTIPLSGDLQVPEPTNSTATGAIAFVYSEATDSIYWAMDIFNPEELGIFGLPGAHIHCGSSGENGAVLVPLVGPDSSDDSEEIGLAGEITSDSIVPGLCFDSVMEIWAAMTTGFDLYVQVHSEENPAGELRGDMDLALMPPASNVVAISLTGDQQVPEVNTTAMGVATFVYSETTESIGWAMDIANPDGLAIFGLPGAHIHCGGVDDNGGVIVTLVGPNQPDTSPSIGVAGLITSRNFSPGLCFDNIPDLWDAMVQGAILYVNVHSEENPSGEIRGNLGAAAVPPPTMGTPMPSASTPEASDEPTATPVASPPTSMMPTAMDMPSPATPDTSAPTAGPTNSAASTNLTSLTHTLTACLFVLAYHVF